MYHVTIELEGISPLRMNRFTVDLDNQSGAKLSREEKIKFAREKKVYKDDEVGFFVPANALKSCIVNGGKRVKAGRRAAAGDLRAIFHVSENKVSLLFKKENRYHKYNAIDGIHEAVVHIPPGPKGVKVIAFWPFFNIGWHLKFEAQVLDDRFALKNLENSIIEAGIYCGLLDGRPDWGRFVLKKIDKI